MGTLGKLKKKLYSKNQTSKQLPVRDPLEDLKKYESKERPETKWTPIEKKRNPEISSIITKFIWGLILFVSIIIVSSLAYLFGEFDITPSGQINFEISGPSNITGGEKAVWDIKLENKNGIAMEDAEIIFEYPANSRPVNKKISKILSNSIEERRDLGRVEPKEEIAEVFEAFIFGKKDSLHNVSATLEYRTEGSNAILIKKTSTKIEITRSPINISMEMPDNINIGQEMNIDIIYSSNTDEVIDNLTLEILYPSGFEFISAEPQPTLSNNIWNIKNLGLQGQKTIRLKGTMMGANLENKIFNASIGEKDENGNLMIYGADIAGTTLKKPYLDLAIKVNNQNEYASSAGDMLSVNIIWKNNLPVAIENTILEIKLEGESLDYSQVNTNKGFYRGSDRTLLWNSSSYPTFSFLQPGQEGELNFSINVLDTLPITSTENKNFIVKFNAHMYAGKRPSGFSGVDIDGKFESEVKISSDLQVSRQGYFYSGLIPNSGPLPPKVDTKTTYTIVWSLANSSNDLKDVKIFAVLPSYVSWEENYTPSKEDITYDKTNGRVTWKVDKLLAGTGLFMPAREVTFQIGITPSLAQIGNSPILISEVVAEGKDSFTDQTLRDTKGSLTTRLPTDPQIKDNEYNVIK